MEPTALTSQTRFITALVVTFQLLVLAAVALTLGLGLGSYPSTPPPLVTLVTPTPPNVNRHGGGGRRPPRTSEPRDARPPQADEEEAVTSGEAPLTHVVIITRHGARTPKVLYDGADVSQHATALTYAGKMELLGLGQHLRHL